MGERKGTNHYYPPDYDPKKGGLNKFLGTHALRERARKVHLGILIIRFEMPYNIWCEGCGNHIGMGVRYNAEKKKIGMYYSTPVYQFRMKCHLCDNHFEIKTDPGNFDYIIVSGARRQENRWDPTENDQIVPEDKQTSKRLFDDAMFKLEHGEGDKAEAKPVVQAAHRLIARRDEIWQDDFRANSALRAKFRASKRAACEKDAKDTALSIKFGLDIKLLPEDESDEKIASLLSMTPAVSIDQRRKILRKDIINQSVLPSTSSLPPKFLYNRSLVDNVNFDLGITVKRHPSNHSGSNNQSNQNIDCHQVSATCLSNNVDSSIITSKNNVNKDVLHEKKSNDEILDVVSIQQNKMCVEDPSKVSLVSSLYNDSSSSD